MTKRLMQLWIYYTMSCECIRRVNRNTTRIIISCQFPGSPIDCGSHGNTLLRLHRRIRISFPNISILRIIGAHVAEHCPFRDHRDGPCWESQAQMGRLRYMCRFGVVFCPQSIRSSACISRHKWNHPTNMLIDENNADVLPLLGELVESRLDSGGIRLIVDN